MSNALNTPVFIRCKHEFLTRDFNPFGFYDIYNNPVNLIQVATIEKAERQTQISVKTGKAITRDTLMEDRKTILIKGIRFRYIGFSDSEQFTDWWYPYGLDIQRDSDYETIISAFEFKY